MKFQAVWMATAAVAVWSSMAVGAVVHNEAVDGDLSSDPNGPTALVFSAGSNSVSGTMIATADTRDYLTFSVPAGHALTALRLLNYEDVATGGGGDRGFLSINAGTTSFIPSGPTAGSFLGGNHLDPAPAGTDLLPSLAVGPIAGTGFSVPLGAGDYTFLVQQTGSVETAYAFDFEIAVIPEPGSGVLLVWGAAAALLRRRR